MRMAGAGRMRLLTRMTDDQFPNDQTLRGCHIGHLDLVIGHLHLTC